MSDQFYISYSAHKLYKTCPSSYEHKYVLKTKYEKRISDSIYGSSVGILMQWFYDKELWKQKNVNASLEDLVSDSVREAFRQSRCQYDHDLANETCREMKNNIPNFVHIVKTSKLLYPINQTEVDLTYVKKTDEGPIKIAGRADFIFFSSESVILDGKCSQHRDKYTDPTQLIWYTYLYYMKYRKVPDRIGYIFWRFPDNPVSWIEFNENDIRALYNDILDVSKKIKLKVFPKNIGTFCKICDYQSHCPDGSSYVQDMKLKENNVEDTIFNIEFL